MNFRHYIGEGPVLVLMGNLIALRKLPKPANKALRKRWIAVWLNQKCSL
jgi:hypothetical protein